MEIINWLRRDSEDMFFVTNYGSYDQDLSIKFYNREQYIKILPAWTTGFLDYWATGDCKLLAYADWLAPSPDASLPDPRPMWSEVAQNQDSGSENFIEPSDEFEQILKDYIEKILSGIVLKISFTSSDDQYFALNTGVVQL